MRLMIAVTLFVLLLTGCTPLNENQVESKLIQVGENQAEDIPFVKGQGRTTIVYEKKSTENGLMDVSVLLKELNTEETYQISIVRDDKIEVLFGPKENVDLKFGKMVGETLFKPNNQGELFVSMANPTRLVLGAKQVRIKVTTKDGKEKIATSPFTLKED